MKPIIKRIIRYFLQGVLVIFPLAATVFIILYVVKSVDDIFGLSIPGLGLVLAIVGITFIGFLFSNFIGRTVFSFLDEVLGRTPLVKLIYSSLKDLIEAFVGEKKKFKEPVLIQLYPNGTSSLGFITRKDLTQLGLGGRIAVYIPYSYSLTGRVFIVPAENITPLKANATEVMKFIVSGGVTGFHE